MELRNEWSTKVTAPNNLRVATYNILADLYAGREIESHYMYGHCDLNLLVRQRRMPMIIAELLSCKADILCLQEVDLNIYETLLRPVLEANGYQGFFSNKVSSASAQEGCCTFWLMSQFEVAEDDDMRTYPLRTLLAHEQGDLSSACRGGDVQLSRQSTRYFDAPSSINELKLERWESISDVHQLFEEHDEIRRIFREKVGQIMQVVRLRPKPSTNYPKPESIIVANTHLFYHPMADHVRMLQMFAVCHKLDGLRREGLCIDPILICGDFNSSPLSGAVRLLTNRSVLPNENDCWKHLHNYTWECGDNSYMLDKGYIGTYTLDDGDDELPCYIEEEFVDAHGDESSIDDASISAVADDEGSTYGDGEAITNVRIPAVELPSSFPVLVSGCLDVPKFTNYATDFEETLDYVFASQPSESAFGFRPKGEAPMLTEDMVKQYVAMPNEVMPSDHVSVICDFEWMNGGENRG